MAGIAGAFANNPPKETVERMLRAIEHRGPDVLRTYHDRQLCAGVRSAALSPARGDGFARDGNATVFLDGEIYNDRGSGASDAEVVLDLYARHGSLFAAHADGVFACAVYDGNDLILTRDPLGVRPLYWGTRQDGGVCFASELKALVGVVDDVHELRPSTAYSVRRGVFAYLRRYRQVAVPARFDEAAGQVRRLLTDAVARRLADRAVGACLLSGGLDSSIITALAHDVDPELPAVTVGIEGAPDLDNAQILAKHLGIRHHVHICNDQEIARIVPRAVWTLESFDEDCVSGAIANLFASAAARELTNCILSGEGGDELFGGYHLLKDLPAESDRLVMMQRLIEIAYNTALQRLDRAMMGNSINYRTPFLDTRVIALALQLPVRWKIHDAGGSRLIEKYILREAFRDILPKPIYERQKLRFSAGTGTDDHMDAVAKGKLPEGAFNEASRHTPGGYRLHSPKELWYYRLFKERFPDLAFEKLVGRWDPGK